MQLHSGVVGSPRGGVPRGGPRGGVPRGSGSGVPRGGGGGVLRGGGGGAPREGPHGGGRGRVVPGGRGPGPTGNHGPGEDDIGERAFYHVNNPVGQYQQYIVSDHWARVKYFYNFYAEEVTYDDDELVHYICRLRNDPTKAVVQCEDCGVWFHCEDCLGVPAAVAAQNEFVLVCEGRSTVPVV
ncbi:OLC1v1030819C1 [Oldenlandia corymbosa var. corymbosa]|uniref:OLC1v1030819C1 n=1 Tax=Oldenlandia corymbosa var. corymbosa TaxID=529605 RepID=A0AAV1CJY7_OLDCO|nr:OLC1v1030819C1 [Oldenlandia corymbosa var. corymbosa]